MNAHECSNRLKDWVSKNKMFLVDREVVDINELIDELNEMEFDESGDEE